MSDLYRKTAIEKLANPEQLDKTVRITSRGALLVLAGILLIVAAILLCVFLFPSL